MTRRLPAALAGARRRSWPPWPAAGPAPTHPTPVASRATAPATPIPGTATPAPAATGAAVTAANCLQSYAPQGTLPGAESTCRPAARCSGYSKRGRLIAGVSADTLLLGARNPVTGQIEGFDIDMLRAVAQAIFGDPDKVELRVITAADRIPLLQDGNVDIVARNMTITCARWKEIAFTTEYYRAGQKVLVPLGYDRPATRSGQDLKGKKVCAPNGSTSLDKLRTFTAASSRSRPTPTPAASCSSSRAPSTPSPVTTPCWPGWPRRTPTPRWSGAGVHRRALRPGLQPRTSTSSGSSTACSSRCAGTAGWTAATTRWLAGALGPAPAPPTPVYGRDPVIAAHRPPPPPRGPRPAGHAAGAARRRCTTSTRSAPGATSGGPSSTGSTRRPWPAPTPTRSPPTPAVDGAVEGRRRPARPAPRHLGLGPGRRRERERLSTLVWGRLDTASTRAWPARRRNGVPAAAARSRSPCPRRAGSPTPWPPPCGCACRLDPADADVTAGCGSCGPRRTDPRPGRAEPAGTPETAADRCSPARPPGRRPHRAGQARRRRRRPARPAGEGCRAGRARPHRRRRAPAATTPTTRPGPGRCAPSSRPAGRPCATWPPAASPRSRRRPGSPYPMWPRSAPVPHDAGRGRRLPGPARHRRPGDDHGPGGVRRCAGRARRAQRPAGGLPRQGRRQRRWPARSRRRGDADLAELYRRAREVLDRDPADLTRAGALLAAYQAYLGSGPPLAAARRGTHDTTTPAPSRAAPGRSWTATATSAAARRPSRRPDRDGSPERRLERQPRTAPRRGDRLRRDVAWPGSATRPSTVSRASNRLASTALGSARAAGAAAASPAGSAPRPPGCAARGSARA